MVYTTNNTPICRRLKDFILSIFSLIYLFFATIFGDPKAMNGNINVKRCWITVGPQPETSAVPGSSTTQMLSPCMK